MESGMSDEQFAVGLVRKAARKETVTVFMVLRFALRRWSIQCLTFIHGMKAQQRLGPSNQHAANVKGKHLTDALMRCTSVGERALRVPDSEPEVLPGPIVKAGAALMRLKRA